jgi:hypothetical protein
MPVALHLYYEHLPLTAIHWEGLYSQWQGCNVCICACMLACIWSRYASGTAPVFCAPATVYNPLGRVVCAVARL